MPSDKDRLYVALYLRGSPPTMPGAEDTYHWGLIVGPKDEGENKKGMRYHAKDRMVGPGQREWFYEEREIPLIATQMLLVRILVGKVTDMQRLIQTLRAVPIVQSDPAWNCVTWVKNGLQRLQADGKALGTCQVDWTTVSNTAMQYCRKKRDEHRFDGSRGFDMSKAPTYDLLEGRETVA